MPGCGGLLGSCGPASLQLRASQLVPASAGEAAERDEADQSDDQADPEAPDEHQDDPHDHEDPSNANSAHHAPFPPELRRLVTTSFTRVRAEAKPPCRQTSLRLELAPSSPTFRRFTRDVPNVGPADEPEGTHPDERGRGMRGRLKPVLVVSTDRREPREVYLDPRRNLQVGASDERKDRDRSARAVDLDLP